VKIGIIICSTVPAGSARASPSGSWIRSSDRDDATFGFVDRLGSFDLPLLCEPTVLGSAN
jgi:hypothetical protein